MKTRCPVLVAASLLLVAGCRTPLLPQADLAYPDEIDPAYFLLGALDEYQGRYIVELGDDTVESFYKSERKEAEVFAAYLSRLVREEKINTTVRTSVGSGGHISFLSPELRYRLNSMYDYTFERNWGYARKDKLRNMTIRTTSAYVSSDVFEPCDVFDPTNRRVRISYLCGAYMRYGNGDAFLFANAYPKVELVVDLLKQLGCRHVGLKRSPAAIIPASSLITFDPTDSLRSIFSAVVEEKRLINASTEGTAIGIGPPHR